MIESTQVLAASSGYLFIGAAGVGVLMVCALIWAVWLGIRIRDREPEPPDPEDQPHLPRGGAVRWEQEAREFDEMPRSERRLMPYEMGHMGNSPTRRAADQRRRKWTPGSSGSFGSGRAGRG
ncbi:DUF6479 family protein [Streptomyces sp. NPDC058045]|uniref:DUF6479 family protein n=1 Tax=Streptomyces sp. NPDC058045 TaxID=3346311 RepID=UPI0036ECF32F